MTENPWSEERIASLVEAAVEGPLEACQRGLELLRSPFPPHQIGRLPKPTRAQTDEIKADFKKGIRCAECGGWHHPKVVHLDYVGHAALTDRLLDCDIGWQWEPLAMTPEGLPLFDANGGLWIRLTVRGVTRLGYGNAPTKKDADPGSREKEIIGDALRNAAMRFGAALELWHKGDLHKEEEAPEAPVDNKPSEAQLARLRGLSKDLGLTPDQRAAWCIDYAGMAIAQLTAEGADKLIVRMTAKLEEKK